MFLQKNFDKKNNLFLLLYYHLNHIHHSKMKILKYHYLIFHKKINYLLLNYYMNQ